MKINNRIDLIKVTQENLNVFAKLKVIEIHYHKKYADISNITDTETLNYTETDATSHFCEKDYYQYLISVNYETVGILEYKLTTASVSSKNICELCNIYIVEEQQNKGYATDIISYLKKTYHTLELDVYYNLQSKELYKSLGFKEIYSRMILE